MIDVCVGNDDGLHAQFVLCQNGQNLIDLVAGVNDYGFAALLVAKNRTIALQYADWQDFVDHSLIVAGRSRSRLGPSTEAKWGGPPGPRGSPWTRSLALDHTSSQPTWASAADQGSAPLGIFNGAG